MAAFPLKFKPLLETKKEDITTPSHVWVTYCVCAINNDSCGWGGWTLEAVFSNPESKAGENILPSQNEQRCPNCGGETFRTEASYRFDLSVNQSRPEPGIDYDITPMKYKDE